MLASHLAQRVGLVAALLVPAAFVNLTQALPPLGGTGQGQHGGNGVAKELHAAKALLEHADHDYDGYRAKAVHHITEALHELHGHQHNGKAGQHGQSPKAGQNKGGAAKLREPQGNSDAQLREAAQLLATAEGKLGSSHPKAHAEVQAAINDIAMALKKK
jgi:hypothetical protein